MQLCFVFLNITSTRQWVKGIQKGKITWSLGIENNFTPHITGHVLIYTCVDLCDDSSNNYFISFDNWFFPCGIKPPPNQYWFLIIIVRWHSGRCQRKYRDINSRNELGIYTFKITFTYPWGYTWVAYVIKNYFLARVSFIHMDLLFLAWTNNHTHYKGWE